MSPIQAILELSITLIKNVAVIIVLAYVFTRTQVYSAVLRNKLTFKHRVSLILIFGVFSIYGTLSGIKILGGVANIRDLGPAIAGLVAGPWIGLGAGLIGAGHRFWLGGLTASSCALSTIIAGILGGIIYKINRGQFAKVLPATIFMMAMEGLHMILALLISRPYNQVLALVKQVALPMIVTNGMGMAVFAFMVWNLIREKETETTKELIEGELKVAREIQLSMVPKLFPPYPERDEFNIYALLEPAKEVGGDLYDFFLVDQDTLYFAVGDVSGKGVPASLFMAVTKTLVKSKADSGLKPDEVLSLVNDELCRDNHSNMFVTLFLGCLDIPSGRILYCSGGHNPPYLLSEEGRIRVLEQTPGMALGVMEGVPFGCAEFLLGHNETLVLYTDGVIEAVNPQGLFYGKAQFEQILKEQSGATLKIITRKVWDDVNRFTATAPQTDDVTLLMLQYR